MWRVLGRYIAIAMLLILTGCQEAQKEKPQNMPMPVEVAKPISKQIVEHDEYIGRFSAVEEVEVKARVSGYLDKISFKDGQLVKAGDVLFVIDQRPFRVEYELAQGELEQAKAERIFSKKQLERYKTLIKRKVAADVDLDDAIFKAQDALAKEKIAQARVDSAVLNLQYTEVKAPIDGRISRNLIDVGNLIEGGENQQTLLTRIVSLDPINFYFEIDENNYLKYSRLFKSGEGPTAKANTTPVKIKLMDENNFIHEGVIDFVDNVFDPESGTLLVRATVNNPDNLMQQGQFGRLQLPASKPYKAVLLPDRYVINEQDQYFVMTVDKDNKVARKPVTVGPLVDNLRVIRTGLTKEDHVLLSNIQMMRPGMVVSPKLADLKARKEH